MSPVQTHRSVNWLVTTCQAGMVLTGFAWFNTAQFAFASIAAVAVVLCFVSQHVTASPTLSGAIRAVAAVLLGAHVVLGMGLGLYESSSLYDKLMHALGIGAIAVLLILAVSDYCQRKRLALSSSPMMWLVLCASVSIGTAWELFEFAMDLTGLVNAQRGLHDTMLDLAANSVGVLTVVVAFAAWQKIKHELLSSSNGLAHDDDIHKDVVTDRYDRKADDPDN